MQVCTLKKVHNDTFEKKNNVDAKFERAYQTRIFKQYNTTGKKIR